MEDWTDNFKGLMDVHLAEVEVVSQTSSTLKRKMEVMEGDLAESEKLAAQPRDQFKVDVSLISLTLTLTLT